VKTGLWSQDKNSFPAIGSTFFQYNLQREFKEIKGVNLYLPVQKKLCWPLTLTAKGFALCAKVFLSTSLFIPRAKQGLF
jgi:hypothetical protein